MSCIAFGGSSAILGGGDHVEPQYQPLGPAPFGNSARYLKRGEVDGPLLQSDVPISQTRE